MGYATYYSLKLSKGTNKDVCEIAEIIGQDQEMSYALAPDFDSEDCPTCNGTGSKKQYHSERSIHSEEPCKWYDHSKDMKKLSKKFPNVIFELSGEGEEAGDLWKKYYKDGKEQVVQAKVEFESFDESKLG